MKMKALRYCSLLLASGIMLQGCTKNFEQINTDPTVYTQSNFDPNYLLTSAQLTYTGSTDFA